MKARLKGSVRLSKEQKQILNDEVKKYIIAEDKKFSEECDAIVLFTLCNDFDFTNEQLIKFWNLVHDNHQELINRYEFTNNDEIEWLYKKLLKDKTGIDIEKLYEGVV